MFEDRIIKISGYVLEYLRTVRWLKTWVWTIWACQGFSKIVVTRQKTIGFKKTYMRTTVGGGFNIFFIFTLIFLGNDPIWNHQHSGFQFHLAARQSLTPELGSSEKSILAVRLGSGEHPLSRNISGKISTVCWVVFQSWWNDSCDTWGKMQLGETSNSPRFIAFISIHL